MGCSRPGCSPTWVPPHLVPPHLVPRHLGATTWVPHTRVTTPGCSTTTGVHTASPGPHHLGSAAWSLPAWDLTTTWVTTTPGPPHLQSATTESPPPGSHCLSATTWVSHSRATTTWVCHHLRHPACLHASFIHLPASLRITCPGPCLPGSPPTWCLRCPLPPSHWVPPPPCVSTPPECHHWVHHLGHLVLTTWVSPSLGHCPPGSCHHWVATPGSLHLSLHTWVPPPGYPRLSASPPAITTRLGAHAGCHRTWVHTAWVPTWVHLGLHALGCSRAWVLRWVPRTALHCHLGLSPGFSTHLGRTAYHACSLHHTGRHAPGVPPRLGRHLPEPPPTPAWASCPLGLTPPGSRRLGYTLTPPLVLTTGCLAPRLHHTGCHHCLVLTTGLPEPPPPGFSCLSHTCLVYHAWMPQPPGCHTLSATHLGPATTTWVPPLGATPGSLTTTWSHCLRSPLPLGLPPACSVSTCWVTPLPPWVCHPRLSLLRLHPATWVPAWGTPPGHLGLHHLSATHSCHTLAVPPGCHHLGLCHLSLPPGVLHHCLVSLPVGSHHCRLGRAPLGFLHAGAHTPGVSATWVATPGSPTTTTLSHHTPESLPPALSPPPPGCSPCLGLLPAGSLHLPGVMRTCHLGLHCAWVPCTLGATTPEPSPAPLHLPGPPHLSAHHHLGPPLPEPLHCHLGITTPGYATPGLPPH
ncbi:hypothetical protein GPJ56_007236 [Histomonas meleagridis]|nr:hypothetical protein GPJ56_007236 [Histomonas meleagridis]